MKVKVQEVLLLIMKILMTKVAEKKTVVLLMALIEEN
jgi:hypothetical protein